MKNILAKANLLFVSLALLLSFSCKQNLSEDYTDEPEAYLTISVAENQRTIFPEGFELSNLTDVTLLDSSSTALQSWSSMAKAQSAKVSITATNKLESFTLTAKYGSMLLSGTSSVVLKSGANSLNFVLDISSIGSGSGKVNITLKIPTTQSISSSTFTLLDYSDSTKYYSGTASSPVVNGETTSVAFKADNIPAGKYKVYIQSALADATYASYSDLVYVSANKTSTGEYECTTFLSEELASLHTFTFKDGDTVLSTKDYFVKNGFYLYFDTTSYTSTSDYVYFNDISIGTYAVPAKEGYVFAGWYTDADCTASCYGSSNSILVTGNMTFYARFVSKVSITYITNGGSTIASSAVGLGDQIYFYYGSSYYSLYINGSSNSISNPTKEGYAFAGWYTDSACSDGNKIDSSNMQTISADVTYYAKWNVAYTISFNTNSGSAIDSKTVVSGDQIYFEYNSSSYSLYINGSRNNISNPTKEGYLFDGWYTDSACSDGNKIDSSNMQTISADVTYYAKWNVTYTITFVTDDGSTIALSTVGSGNQIYFSYYSSYYWFYINDSSNSISNPTKAGYAFGGWYTDSACSDGNKVDSSNKQTISADVTYYAKWNVAYTITFDTDDGSSVDSKTVGSGNQIYFSYYSSYYWFYINDSGNYISNPTKAGYAFGGWYTDSACSDGNKVDSSNMQTISANVTYYAKWNVAYTITFDTNGGSTIAPKTVGSGDQIYFRYVLSSEYYLYINDSGNSYSNPTKSGYTFDGWYTDSACSDGNKIDSSNEQTITADVTYYAKWTTPVTISYDTNGGSTIASSTVSSGDQIYFSYSSSYYYSYKNGSSNYNSNPTKAGYVFGGWYTDSACSDGNKVDSSNKQTITADVTYYAKWNVAYTISFNTNGGSSVDSKTVGSGDQIYFYYYSSYYMFWINNSGNSNSNPTKSGYTFAGWYTDSACSANKKVDSSNKQTITADVTYYAKWTKN